MGERDPTYAVGEPLQEVLPPVARGVQHLGVVVHLGHDLLDHSVEEVLPSRHVAVQRHRLDAQHGTEPTHREPGQPVLLDEPDRGRHDALASQGLPADGASRPATRSASASTTLEGSVVRALVGLGHVGHLSRVATERSGGNFSDEAGLRRKSMGTASGIPRYPLRARVRARNGAHMKAKAALLVGAGVGYVLGTRDGRERYEQLTAQLDRVRRDPGCAPRRADPAGRPRRGVDRHRHGEGQGG